MSAATLAEPQRAGTTDEDETHIVCCDPDRSLCGEQMFGEFVDDETPTDCADCADLNDRPCGVPFCRLRQWWRSR